VNISRTAVSSSIQKSESGGESCGAGDIMRYESIIILFLLINISKFPVLWKNDFTGFLIFLSRGKRHKEIYQTEQLGCTQPLEGPAPKKFSKIFRKIFIAITILPKKFSRYIRPCREKLRSHALAMGVIPSKTFEHRLTERSKVKICLMISSIPGRKLSYICFRASTIPSLSLSVFEKQLGGVGKKVYHGV
jgi:hypothetical protein